VGTRRAQERPRRERWSGRGSRHVRPPEGPPRSNPDSIQKVGSWTERRLDVVGSGWDLAFAHPADELLYPGESRIAGVYRQTAEERTITVRVDCANAPPVEVTRKVKLELNKTEWFPAPEISPST
jgi:hypothetical protein